jgi:hypothetical protein
MRKLTSMKLLLATNSLIRHCPEGRLAVLPLKVELRACGHYVVPIQYEIAGMEVLLIMAQS